MRKKCRHMGSRVQALQSHCRPRQGKNVGILGAGCKLYSFTVGHVSENGRGVEVINEKGGGGREAQNY